MSELGSTATQSSRGTEVAQDGGHSSHVVGVGVGEGDDIEAAELARPEVGRDDLFADVEGGGGKDGVLGVGGGPGGATGVDEHGAASGADNQQRVALADIDGGDFELVGMDGGRHGPEDDCSGEREDGEAAQTQARERRTAQQQKAKQATASRACGSVGPGTRRSAACAWLMRLMAPVTPCSRNASAEPGRAASHWLTSDARKVTRPSEARTAIRGIQIMLAGSAKTVARWKYHGHGKHHDGFGDEADQHELNGPEGCNHGPCGE